MHRSLKALAAISVLRRLCVRFDAVSRTSSPVRPPTDDALDGKADGAVDGAYTYFEVWRDMRKCASPLCGGFFLAARSIARPRSATTARPSAAATCPSSTGRESKLSDDLQDALLDAASAMRCRRAPSRSCAVGSRRRQYRRLRQPRPLRRDRGVGRRERRASPRACSRASTTTACAASRRRARRSPRRRSTRRARRTSHGLDWSVGGFDDDQIAKLSTEMVDRAERRDHRGRSLHVHRERHQREGPHGDRGVSPPRERSRRRRRLLSVLDRQLASTDRAAHRVRCTCGGRRQSRRCAATRELELSSARDEATRGLLRFGWLVRSRRVRPERS